jgi:16S rRNA (guanine527-N7)-methyltransferase
VAPTATPEPTREVLLEGLGELSLDPDATQIADLLHYIALLADWSQRINLTAHRSPDAIARRLILDAAALGCRFGPVASLADIGSGAGLPGVPLAILWRDCRVTLIEPRKKRHHFLRAVVREIGLGNVVARLGRAEDLEPEPHAAAVAQAVADPSQALEWMLPWIEVGGRAVVPGSDRPAGVPEHEDVVGEGWGAYRVPCGGVGRTVWIGKRIR